MGTFSTGTTSATKVVLLQLHLPSRCCCCCCRLCLSWHEGLGSLAPGLERRDASMEYVYRRVHVAANGIAAVAVAICSTLPQCSLQTHCFLICLELIFPCLLSLNGSFCHFCNDVLGSCSLNFCCDPGVANASLVLSTV